MKNTLFALALAVTAAAPAWADLKLATSKSCMGCHGVDRKLVGPAFKDVAAKYRTDKTAVDRLTSKIIHGGSGAWGALPMPANPQVSEADARKLAAWVLGMQ
jgi:cytochrome c